MLRERREDLARAVDLRVLLPDVACVMPLDMSLWLMLPEREALVPIARLLLLVVAPLLLRLLTAPPVPVVLLFMVLVAAVLLRLLLLAAAGVFGAGALAFGPLLVTLGG
jgi:hypothetical protein